MYRIDEAAMSGEHHHQGLRNSEDERVARHLSVARPQRSEATDLSGTRRLRVVPAPGGFAFVKD